MPLPAPDFWEFALPSSCTCLVTDDGSLLTLKLVQRLTEQGWQVVVLSFPNSLELERLTLPPRVKQFVLQDWSEAQLQYQLAAIAQHWASISNGAISAFIHLHPVDATVEKSLLKTVFLLAKHLKSVFDQATTPERKSFLTVARLDGELGLGKSLSYSALSGGLFGLTKTLDLEWEEVFCRAIDLSPELEAEQAVDAIVAELHDPNILIREVGYSLQGRKTLVCAPMLTHA
jgi:NAD(P)-dependent dehydrogenase (short-subunit alcohol dehydrogenase family)